MLGGLVQQATVRKVYSLAGKPLAELKDSKNDLCARPYVKSQALNRIVLSDVELNRAKLAVVNRISAAVITRPHHEIHHPSNLANLAIPQRVNDRGSS
ncbi:hypothetical protein PSAB6_660022 [Paraburkholderia sabiae]|nr:hypothetical protein PSAB6_660022 [Paraburkholderia sabiae]